MSGGSTNTARGSTERLRWLIGVGLDLHHDAGLYLLILMEAETHVGALATRAVRSRRGLGVYYLPTLPDKPSCFHSRFESCGTVRQSMIVVQALVGSLPPGHGRSFHSWAGCPWLRNRRQQLRVTREAVYPPRHVGELFLVTLYPRCVGNPSQNARQPTSSLSLKHRPQTIERPLTAGGPFGFRRYFFFCWLLRILLGRCLFAPFFAVLSCRLLEPSALLSLQTTRVALLMTVNRVMRLRLLTPPLQVTCTA